MTATTSTAPITPVGVLNTAQRLVNTEHGVLQVMVSWPLGWKEDGTTDEDVSDIPVIYILDGNAYFLTAADIVRRTQFIQKKKAVVVGIGYPDKDGVYSLARRSFDMTPPCSKGQPQLPVKDADGNDTTDDDGNPKYWQLGGAAHFQKTIVDIVMPAVAADIVPAIPFDRMRKVLFGHSFGGLFTLYSLFTAPGVFDVYIAASPAIWFNDGAILEHETAFLESADTATKPVLYINSGTAEEDDVFRKPGDTDASFEERQKHLAQGRMNTCAREMAARLRASGRFEGEDSLWLQEFALEDHGSAAVCGLQRGINKLLGEWWVGK